MPIAFGAARGLEPSPHEHWQRMTEGALEERADTGRIRAVAVGGVERVQQDRAEPKRGNRQVRGGGGAQSCLDLGLHTVDVASRAKRLGNHEQCLRAQTLIIERDGALRSLPGRKEGAGQITGRNPRSGGQQETLAGNLRIC